MQPTGQRGRPHLSTTAAMSQTRDNKDTLAAAVVAVAGGVLAVAVAAARGVLAAAVVAVAAGGVLAAASVVVVAGGVLVAASAAHSKAARRHTRRAAAAV